MKRRKCKLCNGLAQGRLCRTCIAKYNAQRLCTQLDLGTAEERRGAGQAVRELLRGHRVTEEKS
jgi:hypothetical protein